MRIFYICHKTVKTSENLSKKDVPKCFPHLETSYKTRLSQLLAVENNSQNYNDCDNSKNCKNDLDR